MYVNRINSFQTITHLILMSLFYCLDTHTQLLHNVAACKKNVESKKCGNISLGVGV